VIQIFQPDVGAEELGAVKQVFASRWFAESGFQSTATRRWWKFEVTAFGRRAPLNDVASTIDLVQLARLPDFVCGRRAIKARYVEKPRRGDRLARYLRAYGVYTTFRYHPLHRVTAYRNRKNLPAAESAADRNLLLPAHNGLSAEELEQVSELT
jgi:dTDP-4-amino-4,6-dideoxygalactose transaminase